MIGVFFASLVIALFIGFIFSPAAVVPAFVILFALIAVANLGKLKCPYCHKRVKLGARVCHHCGRDVKAFAERLAARVPPPPPPAPASTYSTSVIHPQPALKSGVMYCTSCGTALHIGSRFCSSCGAEVQSQPQS